MQSRTFRAATLALLLASPSLAQTPAVPAPRSADLSLGVIQRFLRAGMSTSEVFEAAGSPNLVTRDREGRETWVYDRFSTDSTERGVSAGGGGLAAGGSVLGVLGLSGGASKKTTSQTTLMVSVRFTPGGLVDTFTYRASRF